MVVKSKLTIKEMAAATGIERKRKAAAAVVVVAKEPRRTLTITFGDVAENHAGNQQIGRLAKEGFSSGDLRSAQAYFEGKGVLCELVDLSAADGSLPEASVLVVKDPLGLFETSGDAIAGEILAHEPDKKVKMYGKVVNKHARWNLCVSDVAQAPNYESGEGTVLAFGALPELSAVRSALPEFLGGKAKNLEAELNLYYDISKCGIGFHGDGERRKVVALRLGEAMPLYFQWFQDGKPRGERMTMPTLSHGDMYIMCQKAVGTDWKSRKIPTLRHAAGCDKFTIYKAKKAATKKAAAAAIEDD